MRISDWSSDVCSSDLSTSRLMRAATLRMRSMPAIEVPPNFITMRSEEHTSELQSLMRISYAVFCWNKKIKYASSTRNAGSAFSHPHYTPACVVDITTVSTNVITGTTQE